MWLLLLYNNHIINKECNIMQYVIATNRQNSRRLIPCKFINGKQHKVLGFCADIISYNMMTAVEVDNITEIRDICSKNNIIMPDMTNLDFVSSFINISTGDVVVIFKPIILNV